MPLPLCTFQGESGEWRQHSVFPDSFPGHRLMVVCTHGRDAEETIGGSDSSRRSILNELHLSCPHQGLRVLGGGKLQLDYPLPEALPPSEAQAGLSSGPVGSKPLVTFLPLFYNPLGNFHALLSFGFLK